MLLLPSPRARATALGAYVRQGAYVPVLDAISAAIALVEEEEAGGGHLRNSQDSSIVTSQQPPSSGCPMLYDDGDVSLVHIVFNAILTKDHASQLLGSRYEEAYKEYLNEEEDEEEMDE